MVTHRFIVDDNIHINDGQRPAGSLTRPQVGLRAAFRMRVQVGGMTVGPRCTVEALRKRVKRCSSMGVSSLIDPPNESCVQLKR